MPTSHARGTCLEIHSFPSTIKPQLWTNNFVSCATILCLRLSPYILAYREDLSYEILAVILYDRVTTVLLGGKTAVHYTSQTALFPQVV